MCWCAKFLTIRLHFRSCTACVCFGVHMCVFVFLLLNQSVSFAVVHVVIGHRKAQGPVAHCVLCSSDGHATASPAALLTFCFPSVLMVGRLSSPSSCMK